MSSSSKSPRFVLILDIESGLARASVVNMGGVEPEAIYTHERTYSHKRQTVVFSALANLKVSLDEVTRQFELHRQTSRVFLPRISDVHIVLSSPFVLSQAHTVRHSFKKSTIITPKLINSILDKHDLRPSTHIDGDQSVADRTVFDVSLNGYSIPEWSGKKAKEIDITCIATVTNRALENELVKMCDHIASPKHVHIHSSLLLHYRYSLDQIATDKDHICLNIHDEITDVVCINPRRGIFFGSFPIGHRTLEKRVSQALDAKPHASASALSMHSNLALDQAHGRLTITTVERIMAAWKHEYVEFLKIASPETHTGADIFLSSDEFQSLFWRIVKSVRPKSRVEPANASYVYRSALRGL